MSHKKHSPAFTIVATPYLEKLLASSPQEKDQLKDQLLRTMADLDNYRKRATREKEEAIKFANESFLEQLLPVLDSFELGLGAVNKTQGDNNAIAKGMQLAFNQLLTILKQAGVEIIEAEEQPFNPHLHEAVSYQETENTPDGLVIQQLRKGYKFKERLLRPATVIVAKSPESVS